MKKLVKLAVASAVVFGTSAFAGEDNSAAMVEMNSETCMVHVELSNGIENFLLMLLGTSVHVVENKNMTKSVCQLGNLPEMFYGDDEIKADISACTIGGDEISEVTTEKSVVKVPTYDDHDVNGTMATVECTFRTRDLAPE